MTPQKFSRIAQSTTWFVVYLQSNAELLQVLVLVLVLPPGLALSPGQDLLLLDHLLLLQVVSGMNWEKSQLELHQSLTGSPRSPRCPLGPTSPLIPGVPWGQHSVEAAGQTATGQRSSATER